MNTLNTTHLTDADFKGPHADVSDGKVEAYRTSATNMASGLRTFADQIAQGGQPLAGSRTGSTSLGTARTNPRTTAGVRTRGSRSPARTTTARRRRTPACRRRRASRRPANRSTPRSGPDRDRLNPRPPDPRRPTVTEVTANPVAMQEFVTGMGTAKGTLAEAQTTEAATVRPS